MNWYDEDGYIGYLVRVEYCKQFPFMNGAEGTIIGLDESGEGLPLYLILLDKESMSDQHIDFMEDNSLGLEYPYAQEELELVMGEFDNDY